MVKTVGFVAKALSIVAAVCLLFLIFSAAGDVIMRGITGKGIRGSVEYGEVILVAMAFLGMARTQQLYGHVSVELVTSRFRPRVAATVEFVALAVTLVFLVWMTWASGVQAVDALQSGEYRYGVVQAPVWPARIAIAVSLTALCGVILVQLVRLAYLVLGRADDASSMAPPPIPVTERGAS